MKKHLILILFILFAIETQAIIRYVRPAASGAGDGSSWANASNDLQLMINKSAAGDTVWVAAGTYFPKYTADGYNAADSTYPTTDGGRDNAFILKEDVQLFGGFPNTGTPTWANRDWNTYSTILSGQRGGNPNFTDSNCYHVVISAGNVGTACLDGFTVTKGYDYYSLFTITVTVNGNAIEIAFGNGMYNNNSSPTLTNVIISDNFGSRGSGMYNYNSSPTLTNVTISGNEGDDGSGMYNYNSSPTLTNVTISENIAFVYGGGMHNNNSSPTLTNVTISGNVGGNYGGGMYNNNSSPTLTNVIISGNLASGGGMYNYNNSFLTLNNVTISGNEAHIYGGGIINNTSSAIIRNSIIWGNIGPDGAPSNISDYHTGGTLTFTHSLIEGCGGSGSSWVSTFGTDLGNNLDSNPQFVTSVFLSTPTTSGDYRLSYCSPAVNMGNNAYILGTDTDLDGNPRIYNGIVDLGAYEFQYDRFDVSVKHVDTIICYGDTAKIHFNFMGIPPWWLVYTKDNEVTYDTIKPIIDSLFNLEVNPFHTTTYKFIAVGDSNCMHLLNDSVQIRVHPNPVFTNEFSDDTLCSGEATTPVVFTGDANFYEWTAMGIVSGLPVGLQIGDFDEYIIENKGNTPQTDLITVTPKYIGNGITCVGEDTNFSITVLPEPTLTNLLQNDTLCDEEATKPVVFDGGGNLYEWTATGNVSGIPNSGIDNFGTYTVSNKTTNSTKSVITVKPKYTMGSKECEGDNADFEVVVNPATIIESITLNTQSKLLCEGDTLNIEVIANGENLMYQWYQDGNLLSNERNKDFIVSSVTQAHSGEYYVTVSGACGTENSQTVSIDAGGGNMLVEKWHDVILVDNSSFQYIGYQWYRDGRIINGATEQFYQEGGGLNGCYSVELRLANGGRTRSCEHCAYKTEKSAMYVYPNPTAGKFTILDLRFDDLRLNDLQLEVYDVVGNLLQSKIVNQQSKIVIDISHLASGIYFLKIQTEDGIVMKKVVKE